jgi:hypothetical protein
MDFSVKAAPCKATTWKTLSAVAAAAMIAALINLMPGSDVNASAPAASAKTDRADLQPDCAQRSWPYYKTACLRDDSRNAGRILKVRVVSTDRVAEANPNTREDLTPHWPVTLAQLQIATPVWAHATK